MPKRVEETVNWFRVLQRQCTQTVWFNVHRVNLRPCCKEKTCSDEILIEILVAYVGLLQTEDMVEEGKYSLI